MIDVMEFSLIQFVTNEKAQHFSLIRSTEIIPFELEYNQHRYPLYSDEQQTYDIQ